MNIHDIFIYCLYIVGILAAVVVMCLLLIVIVSSLEEIFKGFKKKKPLHMERRR